MMDYHQQVRQSFAWLPEVSPVDRAFGTSKGIPGMAESIQYGKHDDLGFCQFVQDTMFLGVEGVVALVGNEDDPLVLTHEDHQLLFIWLMACLKSFELKHEHKIGGLGLRLSQTFLGIAYFTNGDGDWRTAGVIPEDIELPPVIDVTEHQRQQQAT